MATYTENLELVKPETADAFTIAYFNENMDTLDEAITGVTEEQTSISEKIGEPTDSGNDTLFGKLNNGTGSVIKSIQHIFFASSDSNRTLTINKVNPAKCIVILERLFENPSSGLASVAYELNETSLIISHPENFSGNYRFGFWIVEFN